MDAVKWRTAHGYSRSAPVYDGLVGHLYLSGFRRLLPLLRLPPAPSILDVGSGTGLNLFEAARRFAPTSALCGIDISPGMVEVARAKAAGLGLPVNFTVGDAEQLPYPDYSFDLVISNSVLHWFSDRQTAIREMGRVLRPGGQLALICASAPGFHEWFSLVDQLREIVRGPGATSALPPLPNVREVMYWLRAAGLRADHLLNPLRVQRVRQPDIFVRQMSVVAPQWGADLTPVEQMAVEQLAAQILRRWNPPGFPNTWSAIEAVATKTAL